MNILLDSLLSILYPPTCPCCGNVLVVGETVMCTKCRLDFPITNFHLKPDFNPLVERLLCHAPITRATARFHYERLSPYARLIHEAKYNGRPSIARQLAREYATELLPLGFFAGIDAIAPVPLSLGKLIKRGYNQSLHIARGIAAETSLPVINILRARSHASQTTKNAARRFKNASGVFSVIPRALNEVNHVLLVDDIATTGATLCACAEAIHAASPATRISVLTLAATRLG